MRQYFKYWVPVFFWMIFIFWMSTGTFSSHHTATIVEPILRFLSPSLSQKMIALIHKAIRKSGHITEYLVFGYLLFRAFRGDSKEVRIRRWVFSSLIVLVLYAASDEFHQAFVSTRTSSLYDFGIDVLAGGIALAAGALLHIRQCRQ